MHLSCTSWIYIGRLFKMKYFVLPSRNSAIYIRPNLYSWMNKFPKFIPISNKDWFQVNQPKLSLPFSEADWLEAVLGLRLGNSRSERIRPMPNRPFLSAFLDAAADVDGVEGPTQSSSTLCTYFLLTSKPQSEKLRKNVIVL